MSGNYHQQTFGPPGYTSGPVSGNSSGPDQFDMLDAPHLFHGHGDYGLSQSLHPLQIPSQGDRGPDQALGYPLSSDGVPLTGLHYTSPNMPTIGHLSQRYEQDSSFSGRLDELDAFSPITPSFHMNAHPTQYPDSNATSTPSTRSPDLANATPIADSVIIEADEDKRKRNQAASARFRQKKKEREAKLVETTRDMQERTKALKAENDGLRKENTFLKKLLVEKVDHMCGEDRDLLRKAIEGTLEETSADRES